MEESSFPRVRFIIQKFFRGKGMGIEILANKGRIICSFQHKRLHEPIFGGGSLLRESVLKLNKKILDDVKEITKKLKYTGVAMFEFKQNSRKRYALIEINGRFWGSLPLALKSGCDFPNLLLRVLFNLPLQYAKKRKHIISAYLSMEIPYLIKCLLWKKTSKDKYLNIIPKKEVIATFIKILLGKYRIDSPVSYTHLTLPTN